MHSEEQIFFVNIVIKNRNKNTERLILKINSELCMGK